MESRQLLESVNAATGFIRGAAVEVLSVKRGVVSMRMPRKPELLQFNGYFHGGAIAGLADHTAGAAATTALPPGRIATEGEGPPAICAIAMATLRAVDAPQVPGKN